MNTNFLKIALRYLWRNRTFSLLNLLCLTFGLTCAIIAILHILTLVNHDKFHKNYKRLYTVEAYVTFFNGSRFPKELMSASLPTLLHEQAPEIEEITRIAGCDHTFSFGDKVFNERGVYADNNLFKVFSFTPVQGNAKNALTDMHSIVISENMAVKYFGTTECLGKVLTFKDNKIQEAYNVTGVFRDIPTQSALKFDYALPFSKLVAENAEVNEPGATVTQVWILLKNNVNANTVTQKIKNLIKNRETTLNQELFLFPLNEKILYSYADGRRVWKEMQNIVMEGIIGFAILLIACFNFINLAIALNVKRHREVGIKKVAGSRNSSIILQFLGETFIITITSAVFALLLTRIITTSFNSFLNGSLNVPIFSPDVIIVLLSIILFTGLVSGFFPALYLASSNPVSVLKGKIITSHSYSNFRQGLIIFQFIIPVVLIIGMIIIKTQDNYFQNFNVGIDREKVIILENSENIQKHQEDMKADLLSFPEIEAVSYTNCIPTRGTSITNEVAWEGKEASDKLDFWCINTDFDYNKALEIKMTAGRFFNPEFATDSFNFVINDIAANLMKYKDPIGKSLSLEGKNGTIIGTFKDFHAIDLAGPLVPVIIRIKSENRSSILIKYSSENYRNVAAKIGKIYSLYEPEIPYQPRVFRDLPEYSNLAMFSRLIGFASLIAILLACLGLFGLASFTAVSRTKEIGIRKVNGAKTITIMNLLLKKYAKWLTIASLIALPIVFFLGKIFLGRFFFRTSMPTWAFLCGPAIVYLIALLTVSGYSYQVSSKNPIKALRYE